MFYMSRNIADQRDMILFGEPYNEEKYFGGVRHFDGMTADEYSRLFAIGAIDPEDSQNCAPAAWEIYEFIKEHPSFTAHGYVVSPERDDHRISLEGVDGTYESIEEMQDFITLFRFADEFSISNGEAYAWFD